MNTHFINRKALLLAMVISGLIYTSQVFAQRALENKSGGDFAVMQLTDTKGIPFAKLYIAKDKTMTFDASGSPTKGAGFYQALKDNYYYVPFSKGAFGGLHVEKIEWDDDGKTVAISGLGSVFDANPEIKIVSDVKAPKLKDGILYLKLEGKGDKEFQFKIVFGKGVSVDPPIEAPKAAAPPAKPSAIPPKATEKADLN